MTVHTDNKDTLINALTENEALKKQLAAANEKLRFQDAWLSDGVYFTNAEYEQECEKNRGIDEQYLILDSYIGKIGLILSDLGFPVGEIGARLDALTEKLEASVLMPKVATDDMLYAYGAAESVALKDNLSIEEAHKKVYEAMVEEATKKPVTEHHPAPF